MKLRHTTLALALACSGIGAAHADNAASRALARAAGFREYADAYVLTL